MTDYLAAGRNLGLQALRRLTSAHKPLVRRMRRRTRAGEQQAFAREAAAVDAEIAGAASGSGPIVAGPWLAEVGYEALYWVPFLRWFADTYRIPPERLTIVSRGGVVGWYAGLAGRYVDIFDLIPAQELVRRNEARMQAQEGGGRKQSILSSLDEELLRSARLGGARVLHPSMMFRLFRHVWHGSLPFDVFWTRTSYAAVRPPAPPDPLPLPEAFVAVKFYSGAATPATAATRDLVRGLVTRVAAQTPVVVLETGLRLDDHEDFTFADIPNVISARPWMHAANNLGVQTAILQRSRLMLGTCGGLAWLAPFLGVPVIAAYADDRQLGPHLYVARQAVQRVKAADFIALDLRGVQHVLGAACG